MWLKIKRKIIILLVSLLVVSLFPNNYIMAEEIENNTIVDEEIVLEVLKDDLSEENISVDKFETSSEEMVLETSIDDMEGNKVEAVFYVEPGADILNLITQEFNEFGEKILKEYNIKINQFENDEFEAIFEDVITGEIFTYNSEEGTASLAFLIPIGIAMSPAVLTALFHAGAMIIVGGAAYVVATKAKKSEKYSHFAAVIKSGSVYIGKGLSKSEAVARFKSGKDTWSISSNQAKGVAAAANPNGQPLREVDQLNGKPRKGYYWHWHAYKKTLRSHAFYGGPVK